MTAAGEQTGRLDLDALDADARLAFDQRESVGARGHARKRLAAKSPALVAEVRRLQGANQKAVILLREVSEWHMYLTIDAGDCYPAGDVTDLVSDVLSALAAGGCDV